MNRTKLPLLNSAPRLPFALDLDLEDWKAFFCRHQLPAFAAKQVYDWVYKKQCLDPLLFSNLPQTTRGLLARSFDWTMLSIDSALLSQDSSEKLLLMTHDQLLIEMVIMPYDKRTTLCISSQVGCRMGCTFCQTGKMGLKRNLSSGEIVAQLLLANQRLMPAQRKISNIVFMGMGEPLDNFDAVIKACRLFVDPQAFNLSLSRVTISTSGLVPEIKKLAETLPLALAISLHAADDLKRSQMMPVNRQYPLQTLKEALLEYPASSRDGITFEYVMIEGTNDSLRDAKQLVRFLHGMKAKVNLIPVNYFPGQPLKASSAESLRSFQLYLSERSIPAPIRYSRGQDVSGGCGQLAAKRADELLTPPQQLMKQRRALGRNAKRQEALDL